MAEVRFSRAALGDLRAIHGYLAVRRPAAARDVIAAIRHSAGLLAERPLLGRTEARGHGRLLVVPRYRYVLSHRIAGDVVEIRYVFHPSQSR